MITGRTTQGIGMVSMWHAANAQQLRHEEKAWNEHEESESKT